MAHGTVGFVLSTLTVVIVVQTSINAHSAVVAVLKILRPTNPAKATVIAMIGLFVVVHPQVADIAMVFTKLDFAIDTMVAVE